MKKIILFFAISLLTVIVLNAQTVVFQKVYNRSYDDKAYDLTKTPDGGFILVGETKNSDNITNMFIIKADENGDTLWTRVYGGDSLSYGLKVIKTNDDNYLIAGLYGSQAYVLKINNVGDSLWSLTIPNEYGSICMGVAELENSDLILIQEINLLPASCNLIYTDTLGNISWNINASANESKNIEFISESEFLVSGFNGLVLYPHFILTKYDISGNTIFNNVYNSFNGVNMCSTRSGNNDIYLGGMLEMGDGYIATIMKADSTGQFLWKNTYFNEGYSFLNSISSVDNNHLVACGENSDELIVLGINTQGDSIAGIVLNEYDKQTGNAMVRSGNFLYVAGNKFDWSEGGDIYFIKLNLDSLFTSINSAKGYNLSLNIFPNPANDKIFIKVPPHFINQNIEIIISNNQGQEIKRTKCNILSEKIEFFITDLKEGIHFVSILLPDMPKVSKKFIILR